jgi:S1-C subfamily serine protease
MRENESDSEDGWTQPQPDTSPWAARDPDGDDRASGDTVAFGPPGDDAGDGIWGSSVPRDSFDPRYAGGDRGGSGSGPWPPAPNPGPSPRGRRRGHLLVYLTVAVLAAGVGAGLTVAFDGQGSSPSAGVASGTIPSPHDKAAGTGSALNLAAVEQKVKPGLVDITAQLKYASETAEGTGMILSSSGLVLTNNHVIYGATKVEVTLADNAGQAYPAQVVGYDSTDDIALLKLVGATGLPTVSFGNSSQVRVGIPVLALGDAGGKGSVTPALGAISGLNRSIQASDEGSGTTEDLNHMLQTNADIQQGDSGGALADNAGQVIGMVTAANTPPGGQPGDTMGFAIPIDTALAIADKIADHQASSTVYIGLPGFLGVEVAQSNSASPLQQAADERRSGDNQGSTGRGGAGQGGAGQGRAGQACVVGGQEPAVPKRIAPADTGALILGVLCGTAAESRGLVPGDVIMSVDGQAVTTPGSLTAITATYHPRDIVSVGWEGINGSKHEARITLGVGPAR